MPKVSTPASATPVTVALVEPWGVVRAALRELLGRQTGIEIVGEASSLAGAAQVLHDTPADVVLVDTAIGGEELLKGLQHLKRVCPGSSIILLGDRAGDMDVFQALQAGAAAHVVSTVRPADLAEAIRAVASGQYPIDAEVAARPVVARRVLEAFRDAAAVGRFDAPARARVEFTPLTRRETEVLTAISEGMTNKQIEAVFAISEHTVRNIVKAVLRKLAVNNRTQAVLVAIRDSLIPPPEHVPSSVH
jgi:DNA-binding NarL/FixJ family response regulator